MKAKPWTFLLVAVAGWIHRKQLDVFDYVREENRVFLEQLGRRRLRLSDLQRRRRAAKAKVVGRKVLTVDGKWQPVHADLIK